MYVALVHNFTQPNIAITICGKYRFICTTLCSFVCRIYRVNVSFIEFERLLVYVTCTLLAFHPLSSRARYMNQIDRGKM